MQYIFNKSLWLSLTLLCTFIVKANTPIEDYFLSSPYAHFTISPDGENIAYSETSNSEYKVYVYQNNMKHLIHTAARFTEETIRTEYYVKWVKHNNRIKGLTWLGNKTIAIKEHSKDGFRRYKIIQLDINKNKISSKRPLLLNQNGYWLNPLTNNENSAVFAKYKSNSKDQTYIDLFRLNLKKKNLDGQTSNKKRFNKKGEKLSYWITDTRGYRTAGTRTINGKPELYIRTGSKPKRYRWPLMWTGSKDTYIEPILLDTESKLLYVLTNAHSDKKVLQTFNIETQKFEEVIYSHPKYDISNAILSSNKEELIGVTYMDGGYTKQFFFEAKDNEKQKQLEALTTADNIYLVDQAVINHNAIYSISSSQNSGELYLYNEKNKKFEFFLAMKPWLKNANLKKTELLKIVTKDNTSLEAFLTLPDNKEGKVPLVVIPHGGPIWVSDSRHYSAEIQVLVNAGYATLQVNFRGSTGYGKSFQNQGMGQWGELIEDDIESALSHAKLNYPIDKNRVCIIGSSYGGYSAIYSLIRSPELYKCGASFAGVTDLALLFQRTDIENNKLVKMLLSKSVGDTQKNQKNLFRQSPVYRVAEITKPLFIAHGTDDQIVDIEHAYRLKFALKANKVPFEWQVLDGVRHGFDTTDQAELYYARLINFLDQHLTPTLN